MSYGTKYREIFNFQFSILKSPPSAPFATQLRCSNAIGR